MKHYLPPSQHVKMMCASALTAVLFFIFTVPAFAAISYPFEIQFLPPASSTETKPDLDITNADPNAEKWPGNMGEFNAKLVLNSEDDIDKISVPTPLWEYERGYKESTLGAYFEAQTLNKKFTTSDELKQLIRDHMNDGKLKSSLWLQVVYIPRVAFYQQDLQDDGTLAVNPTPALVEEHLFGHELTGALPEGKLFEGYVFKGWFDRGYRSLPFGPEKCKFRNFVRYIASYNPLVSFDVNGGVLAKPEDAQQEIEPNSPYAKRPADPTREGYTFVYWQDLATGKKFDFTTAVKKPYKLQAVWRLIPTAQPITVEQGSPAPDAKTGIANANDLPDGTTFAWEHTPSTDTIGTTDQVIVVTQPDGTIDRIVIKLEIKKKDSEKKTPKTKKTKSSKKDKGTSLPQTYDASSIAALLASASAASMFVAGSVLRKKRA